VSEARDRLARRFSRTKSRASETADEQLRLAFNQALIPLAILDLDSRMVRVNQSLCELFGRTPEELLGSTFQEHTHPEHRGDDVEPIRQMLSGERRVHVRQKRYVRADGADVWAEVAISLIRHPDESPSHYVIQVQDITARREHESELRHLADHDPLTGLRNRRGFYDRLTQHAAHVERYEPIGALLMLDLDDFKRHNDTHGHVVGDELLTTVAQGLESRLRTTDVVGRYGGDEFVALLPEAHRDDAQTVAQALIEQISITRLPSGLELGRPVGASVGIVCFEMIGALPASAALICADRAMYQAKNRGGNRYSVYVPGSNASEPSNGSDDVTV
jgi:diguanylate cyclase (GGDEF)-like protein/PAS domain S-box-containing protein